jgi:hypothetical protein
MSGQDGYTAAEALAALSILGLAMAGLTTSMTLIAKGQLKARQQLEQSMLERAVDQRLERLLGRDAPFRSDQLDHLVGDAQRLEVDCGGPQRCVVRVEDESLIVRDRDGRETSLRLPAGETPKFRYLGSYNASSVWPPVAMPPPAPAWQSLDGVAIVSQVDTKETTLAVAKVWRQQRADCEYDVVIQDCRAAP